MFFKYYGRCCLRRVPVGHLGNKKVQKAEPFLCFSNIMGGVAFGESLSVIREIKSPKSRAFLSSFLFYSEL